MTELGTKDTKFHELIVSIEKITDTTADGESQTQNQPLESHIACFSKRCSKEMSTLELGFRNKHE